MSKKNFPFKEGDRIKVYIESMNHEGAGVARYEGAVVFVPFTCIGEKVDIEVKKIKKSFAIGKAIENSQRPFTQAPKCEHFFHCGGCQYQHIDYQEQLNIKRQRVVDAFSRIGGLQDIEVLNTLGADKQYYYRNKVHWQVSQVGKQQLRLGFFDVEGKEFIPINKCHLISENMMKVKATIENLLNDYSIEPYSWDKKQGDLRHVVVRESGLDGKITVIFAGRDNVIPKELVERLTTELSFISSVWLSYQHTQGRRVIGEKSKLLFGEERLRDAIGELKFLLSPESFFQVNKEMTEKLYQTAKDYAQLDNQLTMIDAFCGIGTIALFMADKAEMVYGIEVVKEAIDDANVNKEFNGISNASFKVGLAEKLLPKMEAEGVKPNVVVVDPPRKGCHVDGLRAIVEMKPDRIVYVSCDPASLARDVKFLKEYGYDVEQIQPVDMFPQTSHCEVVCLLQRIER